MTGGLLDDLEPRRFLILRAVLSAWEAVAALVQPVDGSPGAAAPAGPSIPAEQLTSASPFVFYCISVVVVVASPLPTFACDRTVLTHARMHLSKTNAS